MIGTEEDMNEINRCSKHLWSLYKDIINNYDGCEKGKVIDIALVLFRDEVETYKGERVYEYAADYAMALVTRIETLMYGGKSVKSKYFDVKRMSEEDFAEYRKNPHVRDVITEIKPDNTEVRWKVEAVIND